VAVLPKAVLLFLISRTTTGVFGVLFFSLGVCGREFVCGGFGLERFWVSWFVVVVF